MRRDGLPAYTTSVGWLGFSDDEVRRRTPGRDRAGVDAPEDEGRRRSRQRRAPRRADPRGDRVGALPDDGCQPGLGGRGGDRGDAPPGRVRPVVDGGADEPRRHPRPRPDRARGGAGPDRHRRALPQPHDVQAADAGRRRSASASSTRVAWAASTRCSRCCCWPRASTIPVCPARRRGRAVRVRAAPVARRLHRDRRRPRATA